MILVCLTSAHPVYGKPMKNTFFTWNEFSGDFAAQLNGAQEVYESMKKNGLIDNSLLVFDFHFISDKKEKIESLGEYIAEHYPYSIKETFEKDGEWELRGETNTIPVTADNLRYWVLDMYKRGYEFDASFEAYGAPLDAEKQVFPSKTSDVEDEYFDSAIDDYNAGNLSGAIFNWSLVLEINNQDVDSYYSRAIVKSELHAWKSALRDYDQALEIAPDFISALLNRGSLKDENDDHRGAVVDYEEIIKNKKATNEDLSKAYFNKGNALLNLREIALA